MHNLPKEIEEELEATAQDKYAKMAENAEDERDTAYAQGYAEGWHTGATEYATELHQANQEVEELRRRLTISEAACSTINEQETEARDLLRIFISRHEAGLLPDRFIYNDIKSFLDGQK
jgi:flagellar biosynthesis/type III secretory pathway protein FliH